MKENLQEAYLNMHLLSRTERIALTRELMVKKPEFLKEFTPRWWWFGPCVVNVLLVTDGGLDFGLGPFGLSEFITTFQKLEQQSLINVRYKVTLAHRRNVTNAQMLDPNPFITNRIKNFNFDTSVNLNSFDQVWLFGIETGAYLSPSEVTKIENYMNGGGGLFATGDHGLLGSALCSQIPRVKDMRYWDNTDPIDSINEVSMGGRRRNDTNRPGAGQILSSYFDNQSDNIPQNIAVRTFGAGMPHPLLSISTSIRPSGIIDIMPDHPHEGECTQEKVFNVINPSTGNTQAVSSQIIATSFVLGGSTTAFASKGQTDPHCFPSISVFDGRIANIGRIVVDSTWHHFVNVNLTGVGSGLDLSPQNGLTNSDFDVIQRYYMNLGNWMTRKKFMLCWYKWIWTHLLKNSQLIESSLNNPKLGLTEISLSELCSIGMLAKEILSSAFNPAFAHEFMISMIEPSMPELANHLNIWKPNLNEMKAIKNEYYQEWINLDNILGTAVGAGFIALRDKGGIDSDSFNEKSFDKLNEIFFEGTKFGIDASINNLFSNFNELSKSIFKKK